MQFDEFDDADADDAASLRRWYEVDFPASPEGRLVAAFGWTARSEYLTWEPELFDASELGIALGSEPHQSKVWLAADTSTEPEVWVLRLTRQELVDDVFATDVTVGEWALCGLTMPVTEVAERVLRALQVQGPRQTRRRHRAAFLQAVITWATIVGRPEIVVQSMAQFRAEHGRTPDNQFKVVSIIEHSAFADSSTITALRRTYDPHASA